GRCPWCGADIYLGRTLCLIQGQHTVRVHPECFEGWAKRRLRVVTGRYVGSPWREFEKEVYP
ncbi:MAG TPA: hypothetical protein VKU87_04230, partial [Thermomicrobiaceae bacterium]|nr:hypothetical protein [Thermomicrobiaceae bacterium]